MGDKIELDKGDKGYSFDSYIVPLFDRVLLKKVYEEQKSREGIYVPREQTERSQVMEVVSTGSGINFGVKVGGRVVVAKYAGTEVILGVEKFFIVKQCDILAVLKGGV